MRRIACLVLCCVLTAGLFSGCQNNDSAYVPTGDALVMDDGQLAGNAPQQETVQELKLTYYPNQTMNPLKSTDFTNRVLFSLMYQGLFSVDRNYNPEPMLCKEYSISQDMKTYVFYLENATFSDGTPLTNADVVATFAAAKESGYYAGRFSHIKTVSATGENSVTITVDTAMENLPILLDIPILKQDQLAAEFPLGSGPYVWDGTGGTPLLRRRDNWWCNVTTMVTAPAISLTAAHSNAQIRDEFEFNGLNLVCANPGSDKYADYRCDYELWNCENGEFLFLQCNMASEIFSVPEVRAALTFAVDRETIAKEFRGFAQPASLPASPSSPYYSDVQAEKYAYDGGATFNQAVAKAGLVGKPLILLVNGGDTMRLRIAHTIAQALTAAGFVVELKEPVGSSYRKILNSKQYDLYLGQTRLSPNMDLSPYFSKNGSLNHGGIADVALYALCTEALANHGNYYSLHQAVMNDGRLCPVLFSSYAVYATRGLMTGLSPSRDNVFFYSLGKTMDGCRIESTPKA